MTFVTVATKGSEVTISWRFQDEGGEEERRLAPS